MLVIVNPPKKATKKDEIAWIIDKIRKNITNNTQTCIISTYNSIIPKIPPDLFANQLVLYANIAHNVSTGVIRERNFIIDDDLQDIGIFLSRLIEIAKKVTMPVDIIFHNFSGLIHNLGLKETYQSLTYITSELGERINLILFIYPKSHTEQVWEQFKNQAHEVIEIRGDKN